MLPAICHILIKLTLFLSFVNARVVLESVKTQLPGSRIQIKYLADSVCSDLEFWFQNEALALACPENFWNPVKIPTRRTEVKVRCRSKEYIQIEVTPSDSWQLVVLMPVTSEEDGIINYSLIEPKSRFSEISVFTPSRTYTIFSTVLNKEGRPSFWHGAAKLPAWSEVSVPQHRNYDLQVQFVNYTRINKGVVVTGVVTWNHTGDSDVCFDFMNFCSKSQIKSMKIWPDKEQRVIIEKLHLNDQCEVHVIGLYGTTTLKYRTPGLDAYNDKDSSPKASKGTLPEIPHEITLVAVQDDDNADAWQVTAGWAKPKDPPESYNVILGADNITSLVVPGNATEAIFMDVTGEGLYNVSIYAFKGHFKAHNFTRAIFPARRIWRWAGTAGGAWAAVAFSVLAIVLCWLRLRKRIYAKRKLMDQESQPLDEGVDSFEAECEDQWEVKCERLFFHEVIGEGAFGVVRRGTLSPTEKEVAVKMLKEYPSIDEVRSFRLEMELMKSVGAHPHVVSLVGCCSGKRPLIIAEYCSRGDLLSFLRCSWDVMVSKRNAKYYNNIEADYRNDLFKCKIQREHSRLVVNKMYDLQSMCDSDLTSLDLLSFCRQIAMGMEFLANNRLVHRDLAARNVLVTGDRTLKIADFGLSRDVYEENQYKQKGNGKMPVKWMALESLTRRIYSSQSDVWAFGVVLWEVVTVGGAPYPEVPAARLPRLLRAGYRMPRPLNCSKQLYELMLCCWRAHPRERPTFAELHQRLDELLNGACAGDYLSLELDDDAPPAPKAQSYFKMIIQGKRAWSRENYERPLKAVQGNHNHYTSPPVTLSKAPV